MTNVFGDRIRTIRKELGHSGREFGNLLNVTKTTVSRWESGQRIPSNDLLLKIAELGNTTTDWLLGKVDNRDAIKVEYNIDGDEIIMEVSKDIYPDGLTREELIKKLKIIKKMEDMGITFPIVEQD